jgi:hypothetical protein
VISQDIGMTLNLYLPRMPSGQVKLHARTHGERRLGARSVDVQVGEPIRVNDRFGQRSERPGVRDPLMRPVKVIEPLILPQRM